MGIDRKVGLEVSEDRGSEFGDADADDAICDDDPDPSMVDQEALAEFRRRVDAIAEMEPGDERTEAIYELQDMIEDD